jgi:hydroxyacylglutathione hydrolase
MRTHIILGILALSTCVWASEPDGAGLQTGTLPATWKSSSSNCLTTPDYQVHAYNDDFYILRETQCIDGEKPFMYLIFGQDKVLLEDTGAGPVHTAPFVMDLIATWVKKKNHSPVSLIVIHSHSHRDHTSGDKEFQAMPEVQFVLATPPEIQKAAGIANWPTGIGQIDLGGGRIVDVVPIPGHDVASIALYDRRTGNLMTGDSLYPGRLYVADNPAYTASAQRLADFVKDRPIAHVLGTHIEQSQTPYLDYGIHVPQPEEHPLELTRANVLEMNYAFKKLAGKPDLVVLPETSLYTVRTDGPKIPPTSVPAGSTMGLQAGKVPEHWMTGGPNCLEVPDWQVQEYNPDFYILRQSGCFHYEKPFLYLIFGDNKALLEDTGVPSLADKSIMPTASVIMGLMAKWAEKKNHAPVSLVVIHSHAHGDHVAADPQFQAMSNVQFIAATPAEVSKATGIAKWPTDLGKIDLGNRVIDIIPIPGHNEASIALYDRLTGNLMTGDSLYPGRLGVQDFAAYKASAQRLADFVSDRPIAHVLGTHIEQTKTPYLDYPRGTQYQPEEHSLALTRAHVIELNEAFIAMSGAPKKMAFPEFTVSVRAAPVPAPSATAAK